MMPGGAIGRALRIHAAMTRLLPTSFRALHGGAMAEAFESAANDAVMQGGRRRLVRLLFREACDVFVAALRVRLDGRGGEQVGQRPYKRGGNAMRNVMADFRQTMRQWRRAPGFTAVAVSTLALGIGASTAIWTVADGVLFRPLPHEEPEELVWIAGTSRELPGAKLPLSWPNAVDLRADRTTGFEDLAIYTWPARWTVTFADEPQLLRTVAATGNVFALLGNRAALGRTFTEEDARPGAPDVVVVSDGVWRTHLGAATDLSGRTLRFDGRTYDVIGVMPREFAFPWASANLWVPLRESAVEDDRDTNYLNVIGRLAEGMTLEAARPRIEAAMARLIEQYPDANAGKGVVLTARRDVVIGNARPVMLVLLGASLLLLLLACANLANLMLARGAVRRGELAVRTALGAGRRRLVMQLATEAAVLAVVGGALGVLAARGLVFALLALSPPSLPRRAEIVMDLRVLAFAGAATALSGILFGLLPALRAAASDPASTLRQGGRGVAGGRHRGLRGLVVAQLALALVLVSGGGLLALSFSRLLGVDPGFNAEGVFTFRITPPSSRYPGIEPIYTLYDALLSEIEALPGVLSAGAIWALPFSPEFASGRITVEGRPLPEGSEPTIATNPTRGDYFEAMELALRSGRPLSPSDDANAAPVIVINETAARQFWPGEDAVGKRLRRGRATETELPWITVIGVVEDAKRTGLDRGVEPEAYWNHEQAGDWARDMTVVIRTQGDPAAVVQPVRSIVARLDPQLALADAMPLAQRIEGSVAEPRFRTLLLSAFSALALLLALIGTYGVMAFVVANRRHEIGVRMALGADRGRVQRAVLADGFRLVGIAVLIGLAGAAAGSRALTSLLFGVQPLDPMAHGAAVLLLVASALLACWLPARRASRVDPLQTLRDS